jgi:hypothetical protein
MIRIFIEGGLAEYETEADIVKLSLREKLMILGRLEELKQDILEVLYGRK